jgi:hypothetical protein
MEETRKDDFVGRHLIVDASTYTRRNLTSTDTVFALFEVPNRNLDMTAVLPPIVCRYPFANDEIAAFCDAIEAELEAKSRDLASAAASPVDLSLAPVRVMRDFLRRCALKESWVTGVIVDGRVVGDLDDVDFDAFCGAAPPGRPGPSARPTPRWRDPGPSSGAPARRTRGR